MINSYLQYGGQYEGQYGGSAVLVYDVRYFIKRARQTV